ncbi:MAG: thymidine phosphorylase [Xanthomonadales bacterium]|nr:thymidine phosphorylase [Xanthomonadales bacterium]
MERDGLSEHLIRTPQDLIRIKRDRGAWSRADIADLVKGITSAAIDDAQLGALAMAAYLNGLNSREVASLTLEVASSGRVLKWDKSGLQGPVVDKHSTGGVGDTVSLILAPILAAVGCHVPMISGRGLGITGGTLDKLESIPGYNCYPDLQHFVETVQKVGMAIAGAGRLAPADRRLYAVRDATATVDSVGLITASILSKKLAEGLDALVLDVKWGSGAVNRDRPAGRNLSESLREVADLAGLPVSIVLSEMDQPLSPAVGNALEVRLAIDYLCGRARPERLHALVLKLGEAVLEAAGESDRFSQVEAALEDGSAAEVFGRSVAAMGGPSDLISKPDQHLEEAPLSAPLCADHSGRIETMDAAAIGRLVCELGGGRIHAADRIDHAVGVSELASVGDPVESGQPIARIHVRQERELHPALDRLREAISVAEE